MTLANNAEQLNVGVSLLLQLGTGNWGNWELGTRCLSVDEFLDISRFRHLQKRYLNQGNSVAVKGLCF